MKQFETKKVLWIFPIGISMGFLTGITFGLWKILSYNYISYHMFYLAAYLFQKQVNTYIGIAVLVSLLLLGIIIVGHILANYIPWPELNELRGKLFSIILIFFLVCTWSINKAHEDYDKAYFHIMVFFKYDIPIIIFTLVVGWILMKLRLANIAGSLKNFIIFFAGFSLICLIIINIAPLCLIATPDNATRPNIILVSLDALRADHMGCYGYHRNTTPHIDALARENVLFKNAFSHQPWTLTSHMSMLTGLYPITHGVYDWKSLHPHIPTLPEYLKNVGYTTIGFANSLWMTPGAGFERGFDRYIWMKKTDADQHKYIIEELTKIKTTPFFAFIHYYYVHSSFQKLPYDAPPPFNRTFKQYTSEDFPFRVSGIYGSDYLSYINKNRIELSQQERLCLIDLYDNAVAYTDYCIGDLISNLKKLGLYDNTMIIITADHGEEFQEYGYVLHSNPYYYDVLIRVPLILKLPQCHSFFLSNKVIESPIELIDLMPSVLEYLKIQPIYTQGRSFLNLLYNDNNGGKYVYGLPSTQSFYVRSKKWKLMTDSGFTRERYLLFDLINDPQERYSVVNEYPEIVTELENRLRTRIEESLTLRAYIINQKSGDENTTNNTFRLNEQEKERLKSLGYVL